MFCISLSLSLTQMFCCHAGLQYHSHSVFGLREIFTVLHFGSMWRSVVHSEFVMVLNLCQHLVVIMIMTFVVSASLHPSLLLYCPSPLSPPPPPLSLSLSLRPSLPYSLPPRLLVWLSTAPCHPLTHWYQIRCLFSRPIMARVGQELTGTVQLTANER